MEEPTNLLDWELLSDSETNSKPFEEIIHADYFALDSSMPHAEDEDLVSPTNELGLKDIEFSEKNLMNSQHETDIGASFLAEGAKLEMGFEGIESRVRNFDVVDPNDELATGEIDKGGSFLLGDSKMDLGFEGTEAWHQNSCVVDSTHDLGIHKIEKGDCFLVDESKMEVDIKEIDTANQICDGASDLKELRRESDDEKSQELGSDSSIVTSNSKSIFVGDGEKKVLTWWKLPLDILKLCASRVRPVWSIPIAAAVIGILMVGRRLYKMKHKSRRIPLKVSFDDKKATSQFLVRAARVNEMVVRCVPVIRSPLLPDGGMTPWPVAGLL